MNWRQIEGGWDDYKADFQRRWSRIPGSQVAGTRGKRADLAGMVQRAYGISREETETQMSDWQSRQLERQSLPIMK